MTPYKEETTMKTGVYNALKNIYGTKERQNIAPVAFDFVPEKKRDLRNGSCWWPGMRYIEEEKKMKTGMQNAVKNIYKKSERMNIAPVAFSYVPRKNRG